MEEFRKMEQETRKLMTMHNVLQLRDDVEGTKNLEKKEGHLVSLNDA